MTQHKDAELIPTWRGDQFQTPGFDVLVDDKIVGWFASQDAHPRGTRPPYGRQHLQRPQADPTTPIPREPMTDNTQKIVHRYNGGPYMMGGPDVYDACGMGHDPNDLLGILTCPHREGSTLGLPELSRRLAAASATYERELKNEMTPLEVTVALETALSKILGRTTRIVSFDHAGYLSVTRDVAERIHQLATKPDGGGGYIYDHRFRLATDSGAKLGMCADCTSLKDAHVVQQ